VYGPGERAGWRGGYGTVIQTFIEAAKSAKKCEVNGTGEQTRAFTHVDDTIDAIVLVGEKGVADDYPISAHEVYSLLDVVKMVGCEPEFHPATKSTRSSGAEDTSKIEALGWTQKHTLTEYIASVLEKK
jgi:UDP-glucose 4-epimerase